MARVGELVEGWNVSGSASELERDLALELLREIYSEIKFSEKGPAAGEVPLLRRGGCEADGVVVADECSQASSPPAPAVIDETVLEGEDCQMPEPEVTTPSAVPAATPPKEGNREPETETEPELEPEPTIIPRRVDPKVIRSLYGTEDEEVEAVQCPVGTTPSVASATAPVVAAEQSPALSARLLAPLVKATPPPQEGNHPLVNSHSSAPTLGDALNAGHKTLGETLGNGEKDMASHIAAAGQPGLKKSIGLNDRFLMIRDLFDGDAAAFDEAVARLDTFTDLDSAVIHIHDNYDWNADSEGARRLVELLERKFI